MERFTLAAVQMNALKGDLEHNLEVHRRFSQEAAQAGAKLVLFPELSVTAHYGDPAVTEFAQEADRGAVYDAMSALAGELDIVISYGFCEKAHGTHYNSQALMGPKGLIGVQRKTHASRDEYFHFRMGRSLEVFDLGFCRVGTLICFDSCFFEAWRVLALKEAEVLLLPHAARPREIHKIPDAEQLAEMQTHLAQAQTHNSVHAAGNQVFAAYANQWGFNGHSRHKGGVFVVGPDGSTLAQAEPKLEDVWIKVDLDPQLLQEARNNTNAVLKNRRPEIYGEVTRMI